MEKKKEEFRYVAKMTVDALFDAKAMREDLTRDQLNETENCLSDMMQSHWEAHIRAKELMAKLNRLKT